MTHHTRHAPAGESVESVERKEATAALRAVIERQGLDPREYALHSGRIGGATRLAAMGLSTYDILRQGRWKSQAVGMYIRTNREAEACVAFGSDRGRYTSGSHGIVDV